MGQQGLASAAREAGIDAWLSKPVRQSQLFDCLATLMAPPDEIGSTTLHEIVVQAERPVLRGQRLLIAEDNAVNQKVAVHMLERLGYPADVVANGLEALEALDRIPYPLVLMDCQMPEMDGFAATEAIRSREGTERHTPIVAMTAGAMEGDRERCLAVGMDDYIAKPVRLDDLRAVIQRWVPIADGDAPTAAAPEASQAIVPEQENEWLDLEVIARIADPAQGGDPEFLREVCQAYREEAPKLLASIKSAASTNEPQLLSRSAHTLKGSSANIGATGVRHVSEELEMIGRGGSTDGVMDLLTQLEHVLAETDRIMERELKRWTT
jgi:CheY-like chemotaxis protein/HPt (histidine-containing phosphotransfer) domain-containing protein